MAPVEVLDVIIVRCRIRQLRVSLGLSQEQLAHAAGLGTAKKVSEDERMHRGHIPKFTTLLRYAAALGVKVQDLYVAKVPTRALRKAKRADKNS